jgi:prepilin-type N-terminal cleavage/methylation domain-containing protein
MKIRSIEPLPWEVLVMAIRSSVAAGPTRRAFTLIELLVAMAMIVLVMGFLSEVFVTGVEAFRQLKGIGDLNEELRADSLHLRADVAGAHFQTDRFIADTQREGRADAEEAAELRARYVAICDDATDLEVRLRVVERDTVNPVGLWILRWTIGCLNAVKADAADMVDLLDTIIRLE